MPSKKLLRIRPPLPLSLTSVSLCISDCSSTHYVAQADLKLVIFLLGLQMHTTMVGNISLELSDVRSW